MYDTQKMGIILVDGRFTLLQRPTTKRSVDFRASHTHSNVGRSQVHINHRLVYLKCWILNKARYDFRKNAYR